MEVFHDLPWHALKEVLAAGITPTILIMSTYYIYARNLLGIVPPLFTLEPDNYEVGLITFIFFGI